MSSGASYSGRVSDLNKTVGQAVVKKELSREFTVDRGFDIPYLAGYSKDAKTIYIDRHLPATIMIGKAKVDPEPFLIEHERTEKALIDGLGFEYAEAHRYATTAEENMAKADHIDPRQYEQALKPFIKKDEHEAIERVPKDLDLTPYIDSRDIKLLEVIKNAMGSGG